MQDGAYGESIWTSVWSLLGFSGVFWFKFEESIALILIKQLFHIELELLKGYLAIIVRINLFQYVIPIIIIALIPVQCGSLQTTGDKGTRNLISLEQAITILVKHVECDS